MNSNLNPPKSLHFYSVFSIIIACWIILISKRSGINSGRGQSSKEKKTMSKKMKIFICILLSLSLIPVLQKTPAYADFSYWTEDFTSDGGTINNAVTVENDITLTIPEGKTLDINGYIYAYKHTLTISGKGTLNAHGFDNLYSYMSDGFMGDLLIIDGATVNMTGGYGYDAPDAEYDHVTDTFFDGERGGIGGHAIYAKVIINSGSLTVQGGNGGRGGNTYGEFGGDGGRPGCGIQGNLTINGGSVTAVGGLGGKGGTGTIENGYEYGDGVGVNGFITAPVQDTIMEESDDGITWTSISGTSSAKKYIRIIVPETDGNTQDTPSRTSTRSGSTQELAEAETASGLLRCTVSSNGTAKLTEFVPEKAKVTLPGTITANGAKIKLTAIAKGAMKDLKKLTKLTLGKNISTIGAAAFKNDSNLKIVVMPETVTRIGKNAFKGVSSKVTFRIKASSEAEFDRVAELIKASGAPKSATYKFVETK